MNKFDYIHIATSILVAEKATYMLYYIHSTLGRKRLLGNGVIKKLGIVNLASYPATAANCVLTEA